MSTKHARYSPSALKSFRACPGYLNSNDGDTRAADEGSLLHALVEHDMDVDAARKANPEYDKIPLTEKMLELAQLAWDYSNGLIEAAGADVKIFKETRLDLRPLNLPGCEGGTADLIILHKTGQVDLVDYKFGVREIDPIEEEGTGELYNTQFMAYGLGVYLKWPKTKSLTIHMVQPKLEGVDTGTMLPSCCTRAQAIVSSIVMDCIEFEKTKDESMLKPDDELCGWCARQSTCPKWTATVVNVAKIGVEYGIPDSEKAFDPELISQRFTGWEPEEADPVEVAKMLRALTPLESFIKRYKQFAFQVHQLPDKALPGFGQVDSQGKTTIISPIDAMLVVEKEFDVSREEFTGACTISMDALKKLVAEKAPKGKKGLWAEELVEKLSDEGLVERAPGYSYLKASRTKLVD